ncbi:MAG: hypothetical protein IT405_02045 [Candidatus Yanofskybacteria bacterium]|nr:hypothetical protein [Candidatus Yanofskybacteria bacterium]
MSDRASADEYAEIVRRARAIFLEAYTRSDGSVRTRPVPIACSDHDGILAMNVFVATGLFELAVQADQPPDGSCRLFRITTAGIEFAELTKS